MTVRMLKANAKLMGPVLLSISICNDGLIESNFPLSSWKVFTDSAIYVTVETHLWSFLFRKKYDIKYGLIKDVCGSFCNSEMTFFGTFSLKVSWLTLVLPKP